MAFGNKVVTFSQFLQIKLSCTTLALNKLHTEMPMDFMAIISNAFHFLNGSSVELS